MNSSSERLKHHTATARVKGRIYEGEPAKTTELELLNPKNKQMLQSAKR